MCAVPTLPFTFLAVSCVHGAIKATILVASEALLPVVARETIEFVALAAVA